MKIKCKGTLVHFTKDSLGRRIDVRGIDLERFKTNPVILGWHDSHKIPIGLATKVTKTADNSMELEFELDTDLMPADMVNAVKSGTMRCLSSGLILKTGGYRYDPQSGDEDLILTEMSEASVVTIGRNKFCLFEVLADTATDQKGADNK